MTFTWLTVYDIEVFTSRLVMEIFYVSEIPCLSPYMLSDHRIIPLYNSLHILNRESKCFCEPFTWFVNLTWNFCLIVNGLPILFLLFFWFVFLYDNVIISHGPVRLLLHVSFAYLITSDNTLYPYVSTFSLNPTPTLPLTQIRDTSCQSTDLNSSLEHWRL